jgi:hypothetical protein
MRRPRVRVCSAACLALALAFTPPLLGCSSDGLRKTRFPSDGVELRYDLQPGASFDGDVRWREHISARGQVINRSLAFSVQLSVTGVDADGTARVAAEVYNLNLNWMTNDFDAEAKRVLEGVTIRFAVKPDGSVVDVPSVPPDLDQAEVLDSVIEGITSAFVVVPDKRLMAGEGWEDSDARGTLVGMFERRGRQKHELAKLEIDIDETETTMVLFDPGHSYPAVIESRQTRSQGGSVTTVEFRATWSPASL